MKPKGRIQQWADGALCRTDASQEEARRQWSYVLAILSTRDAQELRDGHLHYMSSNGDRYADSFRQTIAAMKAKYERPT